MHISIPVPCAQQHFCARHGHRRKTERHPCAWELNLWDWRTCCNGWRSSHQPLFSVWKRKPDSTAWAPGCLHLEVRCCPDLIGWVVNQHLKGPKTLPFITQAVAHCQFITNNNARQQHLNYSSQGMLAMKPSLCFALALLSLLSLQAATCFAQHSTVPDLPLILPLSPLLTLSTTGPPAQLGAALPVVAASGEACRACARELQMWCRQVRGHLQLVPAAAPPVPAADNCMPHTPSLAHAPTHYMLTINRYMAMMVPTLELRSRPRSTGLWR
jgi:hypothetical protein